MKLTEAQQAELQKKLISFDPQGAMKCTVCGKDDWTIEDEIFEFRPFYRGALNTSGPVFPVVLVICDTCGNTLTLNALILGIVEQPAPEPKDKDAEAQPEHAEAKK